MSPDLGCAQISSLTSLQQIPKPLLRACRGQAKDKVTSRPLLPFQTPAYQEGAGWSDALCSEVKEEIWAQPKSGDMSGTGHPSCLTRSPQKPNKAYLLSIRIASPKPFKVSGNIR